MYGEDCGLADLYVQQVEVGELEGGIAGVGEKATGWPHWVSGKFIKGPIPLNWLGRVFGLESQKTLCVALAIWYLSGLRKQDHDPSVTTATLEPFGVSDRSTKKRALDALEKAGLIRVDRRTGRNPVVTILEVGSPDA